MIFPFKDFPREILGSGDRNCRRSQSIANGFRVKVASVHHLRLSCATGFGTAHRIVRHGRSEMKHTWNKTVFHSWVTLERVLPVLVPKKCGQDLGSLRTSFSVSRLAGRGVRNIYRRKGLAPMPDPTGETRGRWRETDVSFGVYQKLFGVVVRETGRPCGGSSPRDTPLTALGREGPKPYRSVYFKGRYLVPLCEKITKQVTQK